MTRTETEPAETPFVDVKPWKYYAKAVLWACRNEITTGIDATHFNPEGACTRAQMVTFLWKAQGAPEPDVEDCPFTDVTADKYYYQAVLWAVENGITNGVTPTAFAPDKPCTRGQAVTFLCSWFDREFPRSH